MEWNIEGWKAGESDDNKDETRGDSEGKKISRGVQEVDSKLQRQGNTYWKERMCDFKKGAGWYT